MASNLMWLLYLGDVVTSLGNLAVLGLVVLCVAGLIYTIIHSIEHGAAPKYPGFLVPIVVVLCVVLIVVPSRQTIYASAAVYVAGEAANTEEFAAVRKIVQRELSKMVEKK
jgi:cytochrome c oxidase subunit IV